MDFSVLDFSTLLPFIAVGFAAQLVDGALGMAFGVISSTLLISVLGVPPATASAGTHIVEPFTTGVSGISHVKLGTVNRSTGPCVGRCARLAATPYMSQFFLGDL